MEYLGYSRKVHSVELPYSALIKFFDRNSNDGIFNYMIPFINTNNSDIVLLGSKARYLYAYYLYDNAQLAPPHVYQPKKKTVIATLNPVSIIEKLGTWNILEKPYIDIVYDETKSILTLIDESYENKTVMLSIDLTLYPNIESILFSMGSSCNQVCYYRGTLYYTDLFAVSFKRNISFETDGIKLLHFYPQVTIGNPLVRMIEPKGNKELTSRKEFDEVYVKKLFKLMGYNKELYNLGVSKSAIASWYEFCKREHLIPSNPNKDTVEHIPKVPIRDSITLINGYGLPFGDTWLEKVTGSFEVTELELMLKGYPLNITKHIILYLRILKLKDTLGF